MLSSILYYISDTVWQPLSAARIMDHNTNIVSIAKSQPYMNKLCSVLAWASSAHVDGCVLSHRI